MAASAPTTPTGASTPPTHGWSLLALLGDELGIDLARLEPVDCVVRRGGYPVKFDECEAVGIDPTIGRPAAGTTSWRP
jgi:hypothetical protein